MLAEHRRMVVISSTPTTDPDTETEAEVEAGAIMSDDPMILSLEATCANLNGKDWNSELGLTQLLNPSKVVNLEMDLQQLRTSLNATTDPEERAELEASIVSKVRL